jgi:hypothetical protein
MLKEDDLTKLDYEIIEFVNDRYVTSKDEIINTLSSDAEATSLRIDILSRSDESHAKPRFEILNTSYLHKIYENRNGMILFTGKIQIAPLGKKALQDFRELQKEDRNAKTEERIWKAIPIVISIIAIAISFMSLLKAYGFM